MRCRGSEAYSKLRQDAGSQLIAGQVFTFHASALRAQPRCNMERPLKRAITGGLVLVFVAFFISVAAAGDWQWGCMGPMGDEQILFSRYSLVIARTKRPLGVLEDLFRIADLSEKFHDAEAYDADQSNDGLQKTMTFTSRENQKNKLTLIERSSKVISHRHHLVCGRDEDHSTERKIFRVERPNAPTVDVTLQCREYLLTTRGGRPCISN
jgi:hypothetical protein